MGNTVDIKVKVKNFNSTLYYPMQDKEMIDIFIAKGLVLSRSEFYRVAIHNLIVKTIDEQDKIEKVLTKNK